MPPVSPKAAAFWSSIAWSRSSARITPSTGPKHSVQVEPRAGPHADRARRVTTARSPPSSRRRLDEPALAGVERR